VGVTRVRWVSLVAVGALGPALALALAGCGDDGGTSAGGARASATTTGGPVEYEADALVLESPEHGPQVCNFQLDSYPPQCGGPDLVGWDWAAVEGEESANGTTWGTFHVVGTWDADGPSLTLTEPATPPAPEPAPGDGDGRPDDDDEFATPCPRPAGGWAPVDPATTDQAALDAATGLASARPGTAGVWVDQGAEPGWTGMNDPRQLVLDVTTTGDVAALEADLRAVWGGALCVAPAELSRADLQEIAESISGPNVLVANTDERDQQVVVEVYVPDDAMQAEFDEAYGEGVVRLIPWLTPVTP
jgi:hypothetical protein